MKKLTCIAIDDEPLALSVIARFCERRGGLDLETFSEPRLGLEAISRLKPDLVFLDIEMNSTSGLEIARLLPPESCLIFTTAHARYALDGFDLNAVDFLHKPFSYQRFEQAVEKALRYTGPRRYEIPESIVVKQEYSNISIPTESILYIEAMENYSKIYRTDGDCILSRTSLKAIRELLPGDRFLRVHRSYIVATDKIEKFSKREIKPAGCSVTIPVGRLYAGKVFETITRLTGKQ